MAKSRRPLNSTNESIDSLIARIASLEALTNPENANKISASGSNITFNETGIYMAIAQYRSTADLWNKWVTVDANNNIKGQSAWMGSGTNFPNGHSWTMTITQPGIHSLVLFVDNSGDSVAAPAPANGSYLGSANRTLSVVIVKISDI